MPPQICVPPQTRNGLLISRQERGREDLSHTGEIVATGSAQKDLCLLTLKKKNNCVLFSLMSVFS